MKKLLITLIFYSIFTTINAQTFDCEKQLEQILSSVKEDTSSLKTLEDSFLALKNSISLTIKNDSLLTAIQQKQDSINIIKAIIKKDTTEFSIFKKACQNVTGINTDKITELNTEIVNTLKNINLEIPQNTNTTEVEIPNKNYLYFGKDKVIELNFTNDSKESEILNEVLKQTNDKSYLGDICIPKNNQEFYFYNNDYKQLLEEEKYKFKKVDIQIHDGNFADIRVTVSYKNNLYIFENYIGISFLRFHQRSKTNYLYYAQKQPNAVNENHKLNNLSIKISDILEYKYKIGNNYIPSNLVLELPTKDNNNELNNSNATATYQIKEETYLDKVIELRAYTDFLAMFSEESNGLIQLEAKAKFYIFPFPRQLYKTAQIEILKSITPRIHFSRLENDGDRLVTVTNDTIASDNKLELIEKRYLTMGADLNLFDLYHKTYPLRATLFATAGYNITATQTNSATTNDIKAFGYGIGLKLSSKRFNNFGFNYVLTFKEYNYKNYNSLPNVNTNFTMPIFQNQAEVFYHPTASPNQSIFARLNTFNFASSSNNSAFYQFQFGYKFSIGSRSVKDKTIL